MSGFLVILVFMATSLLIKQPKSPLKTDSFVDCLSILTSIIPLLKRESFSNGKQNGTILGKIVIIRVTCIKLNPLWVTGKALIGKTVGKKLFLAG